MAIPMWMDEDDLKKLIKTGKSRAEEAEGGQRKVASLELTNEAKDFVHRNRLKEHLEEVL